MKLRKRGVSLRLRNELAMFRGGIKCEVRGCGRSKLKGDIIDVHHIDENEKNNVLSNLKFLCKEHHLMAHGRLSWVDMNLKLLRQNQSTETMINLLCKNNPNVATQLRKANPNSIRKEINKKFGWTRVGMTARNGKAKKKVVTKKVGGYVLPSDKVTFTINGVNIIASRGSTIEI